MTPKPMNLILLLWLGIGSASAGLAQESAPRQSDQDTKEVAQRQAASKALNALGVSYYQKQEFEKAIGAFRDALKYEPGNPDIRTNLGMVYYHLGQFENIIETLAETSKTSQLDQRGLTALAVAYFALGKYNLAASLYEKLAAREPNDLALQLTLAVAYRLSDSPAQGEALMRRLPKDAQTRAQYHVLLADAHRSQHQLSAAIAEYEKALALVPNLPDVNYRLGVLQSDLHAYGKAVEAFRRELEINPQSADAAYSLGAYFLNYGDSVGKAREFFEKTIQFNPNHLGGYLGLMKIYLDSGKSAEALQLAEKAQTLGLENDELHYLKSRAFNLQGKKHLAEKELQRFEELRTGRK